MKLLQLASILAATTVMTVCPMGKPQSAKPNVVAEAEISSEAPTSIALSYESSHSSGNDSATLSEEEAISYLPEPLLTKRQNHPADSMGGLSGLSYLPFYPDDELPPARKPADVVLEALSSVPIGAPLEEIKRAADAFGLDFGFMRTIAKIESDLKPEQRTGSYIGLFQLSRREFKQYGSGEITSPRDNAIAAAYKFKTEATLFESDTHRTPTPSDLYLIHQQGWQGAAEHVSQPDRIAWKSMCATAEGRHKGEGWCKRAIWLNTLPTIKHIWKSVNNLTSGDFVEMWRERIDRLYARYSEALHRGSPKQQGS